MLTLPMQFNRLKALWRGFVTSADLFRSVNVF